MGAVEGSVVVVYRGLAAPGLQATSQSSRSELLLLGHSTTHPEIVHRGITNHSTTSVDVSYQMLQLRRLFRSASLLQDIVLNILLWDCAGSSEGSRFENVGRMLL